MPDRRGHRGPHPEDSSLFAIEQAPVLSAAVADLSWLLTRAYASVSSLKLVGDRYQLRARQRTAVSRCACSDQQRERRSAHQLPTEALAGRDFWIDGYNVLTTVEAALSGGVAIRGRDGCLRDMASMHGSYHQVSETRQAIELLGKTLSGWRIKACRWLFDQSVSNSGRLRTTFLELANTHGWNWEIELVRDPDPILARASVCGDRRQSNPG